MLKAKNAEANELADAEAEHIAEEKQKFELTKEEKKRAAAEARAEKEKQKELRQAETAKIAEEKKRIALQKAIEEYEKAKVKSAEKAEIAAKHSTDEPDAQQGNEKTIMVRGGKKSRGTAGAVEQVKEVEMPGVSYSSPDRRKQGSNKRINPRSPSITPRGSRGAAAATAAAIAS